MRTLVSLILLLTLGCGQQTQGTIKELPITEYTAGNGMLIDVRTPMEYELGHLQGAVNIDWKSPRFAASFDSIPTDRPLYVYCQKGGRSAKAAELLRDMGYTVTDLTGGYSEFQP